MGPIGCPETSVRNYHCALRKSPEESNSHLRRGGSLKSRVAFILGAINIYVRSYLPFFVKFISKVTRSNDFLFTVSILCPFSLLTSKIEHKELSPFYAQYIITFHVH